MTKQRQLLFMHCSLTCFFVKTLHHQHHYSKISHFLKRAEVRFFSSSSDAIHNVQAFTMLKQQRHNSESIQ